MIKRNIPNSITAANLLAGCIGIVFAAKGEYVSAAICIWIAAVFDFLDGFAARLLKVHSEIGKQLDSLADLVTFGALPGFIVFYQLFDLTDEKYVPYVAFLIPIMSAFRLAKFNIDERQSDHFIGMPTPANAIFFSSLIFLKDMSFAADYIFDPIFLISSVFLFSFLLVAEIPMIALKFKNTSFKENFSKYLLVISALVMMILLQEEALSFIIVIYLILSFGSELFRKSSQ